MRTFSVAGPACAVVLAGAALAVAQAPPGVQLTGSVSPANGGSKQRPRHAEVGFAVTVAQERRITPEAIELYLPRRIRLAGTGFEYCTAERINGDGGSRGCPKRSRVGSGSVSAAFGSAGTTATFTVELYAGAVDELTLVLRGTADSASRALAAPITRARPPFGQKVTIELPASLQRPLGAYAYLRRVEASISGRTRTGRGARRRSRSFASLRGCSDGAHRFGVNLRYVANDAGAAGETGVLQDAVDCRR